MDTDILISYNFHITVEMILPLICFQLFKNVKTIIISSQAVQKQGMCKIWPVGHSLLIPKLAKLAKLESIILRSFCLRLEGMKINGCLPFLRDLHANIFIRKEM